VAWKESPVERGGKIIEAITISVRNGKCVNDGSRSRERGVTTGNDLENDSGRLKSWRRRQR
jgi:hypothetical protein